MTTQASRIKAIRSEHGFISEEGDEMAVAKCPGIGVTIWINREAATLTFDEVAALRSALNAEVTP